MREPTQPPLINRWDTLEKLLKDCAEDDLRTTGEVHPALGAFATERLRFLAWLRPFRKGAYADPMIELLALAMPLDANRLALSMGGRAWSMDDPIPPVTEDADLRQRVLLVHVVDGARGRPRSWTMIHPFDLTGEEVAWQEPQRLDGGEGWILQVMEAAVAERRRLRTRDGEIRKQARRVVKLGHDLYLPSDVRNRLVGAARR